MTDFPTPQFARERCVKKRLVLRTDTNAFVRCEAVPAPKFMPAVFGEMSRSLLLRLRRLIGTLLLFANELSKLANASGLHFGFCAKLRLSRHNLCSYLNTWARSSMFLSFS